MPSPTDPERRRWRRTLRLTGALLGVWGLATFGVAFFARDLAMPVFGWPFSFWMAAQGAPLVYLALVVVHARHAARHEAESGAADSG